MEIAAAAQMAMTNNRSGYQQGVAMQAMKQSLQQDTASLQIIAAALQPGAQASSPPPTSGPGQVLDITV